MVGNTGITPRQPGFMQGMALLLPVTLTVMGVSLLTAVVPLMEEHFSGIPHHEYVIPILMTVPSLWILISSPVVGWLADRFGRRKMLIASMLAYAVVGTMPTYLDDIYGIFIARCGVGICEAVILTVTATMISDYFKGHEREKWLAGQSATASLSALVIIPLGGILGSKLGWRGPFYLYASSLVFVIGVLLYTWEPGRSGGSDEAAGSGPPPVYHRVPWVRVISLCALTLVGAVGFFSIITQNGNALAALGVRDPGSIGFYTALCTVGVPVGAVVYAWLSARLDVWTVVFVEFLLIGAGFWLMGHATTPWSHTAWAFGNEIGCGMLLPTMLIWTTRGLSYEIRGFVTGIWTGAFSLGQFATALVLPYLTSVQGGIRGAFLVESVVALAVAFGALAASQSTGRRSRNGRPTPGSQ